MLRRSRLLALSFCVPALALAACTSAADPSPAPTTSASPTPSPTVDVTDAAGLAAAIRAGGQTVTSAKVKVSAGGGGTECSGTGVATFDAGVLTGLQIDGPAGLEAVDLVIAGDTAYTRTSEFGGGAPDDPWHTVTAESTNAQVAAVRTCAVALFATAAPGALADAFAAGTGFGDTGSVIGGHRYDVDGFSPAAADVLPSLLGVAVTPTRGFVDIDSTGRLLSSTILLVVDGTRYSAQLAWAGFGATAAVTTPSGADIAD